MLENDCSLCFLKDPLLITSSSRQMHMGTKNLKIYCRYNYFIKLIQSYFQLVAQHIGLSEKNYDFSDNSKTKISYHPGYLLSSAPVIIQSSKLQLELMYGKCEFYYWWKEELSCPPLKYM